MSSSVGVNRRAALGEGSDETRLGDAAGDVHPRGGVDAGGTVDDAEQLRRQGRGWAFGRRGIFRSGLAGLAGVAVGELAPFSVREAHAAPRDTTAGAKATPNPLKDPVAKSGVEVELVDFCQAPATYSSGGRALINFCYHAADGQNRLFANDSRGIIYQINPATGATSVLLNLRALIKDNLIRVSRHEGLRSFAFHPDHSRAGTPGYRKFYTVSTESVSSYKAGVKLFTGSFPVLQHDVVAEWTVDAAGKVITASRRELLRIAKYGRDHNADQIMFDPNLKPGDAGYGAMWITSGDGGNVNPGDPYNVAQNKKSALGKLLRILPVKQASGKAYGIPADNPFVGNPAYLPEIWALGLRHPQNLSFDPRGEGTLVFTDIGQSHIEEVNLGVAGANYGWPNREGTFVTDQEDKRVLYALGSADASKGYTYPVAQYDHSEGKAIAGGFVYRGTKVPALVGHYLFGDIVNGRVFHIPVADLKLGSQAPVKELTLRKGGRVVTLLELCAPSSPLNRADLRFGQDQSGDVFIITKQDGWIRKIKAV